MSGGLIATVVAIVSLLFTFIVGRKSGAIKENEKLRLNLEAYTEKMESKVKESEVKAEQAERKADLASGVVDAVTGAEERRSSSPVVSLAAIRETLSQEQAFEQARKQAEAAKELQNR